MAFIEIGMSEKEFLYNPPSYFYQQYLINLRKIERGWDYSRSVIASLYNTAMGNKRRWKPQDIMALNIDKIQPKYERISKETAQQVLDAWKPIKN